MLLISVRQAIGVVPSLSWKWSFVQMVDACSADVAPLAWILLMRMEAGIVAIDVRGLRVLFEENRLVQGAYS